MRRHHLCALAALFAALLAVPQLGAQAPATESAGRDPGAGWIWLQQFAGSTNTYGQVLAATSSAGYNFNSHFGVLAGIPVYFIRNSASTTAASSVNGIGDIFASVRLAWATPLLNYRMALTGAAPSGDSSKGLGAGRATYAWTHYLDRSFGRWTPFFRAGLTNSTSQVLLVQRQFSSTGQAAHFEAGSALRLAGPLSVSASLYDIEPWGTQTVLSRVVTRGGPAAGAGRSGRVVEVSQQTVGSADLTRDRGFNAGATLSFAPAIEFWAVFNRSSHFDLNTTSFGVAVNVLHLVGRVRE